MSGYQPATSLQPRPVARVLLLWTAAQGLWIETDQRLRTGRPPGTARSKTGPATGPPPRGKEAVCPLGPFPARSGEYPALYPTRPVRWQRWRARWTGTERRHGDWRLSGPGSPRSGLGGWLASSRSRLERAGNRTAVRTALPLGLPALLCLGAGAAHGVWSGGLGGSGRSDRPGFCVSAGVPGHLRGSPPGGWPGCCWTPLLWADHRLCPSSARPALLAVLARRASAKEGRVHPSGWPGTLLGPALALGLAVLIAGPWYFSSLTGLTRTSSTRSSQPRQWVHCSGSQSIRQSSFSRPGRPLRGLACWEDEPGAGEVQRPLGDSGGPSSSYSASGSSCSWLCPSTLACCSL